jgi:hypothetical protein
MRVHVASQRCRNVSVFCCVQIAHLDAERSLSRAEKLVKTPLVDRLSNRVLENEITQLGAQFHKRTQQLDIPRGLSHYVVGGGFRHRFCAERPRALNKESTAREV